MPYSHFTNDDRDALQVLKDHGLGIDIVARIIGKHPSSAYREVRRNSSHGCYISRKAQVAADTRRMDSRPSPVRGNKPLMACVEGLLQQDLSPQQIAGRISLEDRHPGRHISHETIYRYIYEEARRGNDLRQHLRQGHKTRRKHRLVKDRRGIIPNRTFIDSRPSIVTRKARCGDWEGDTIEGSKKQGYVATFVERKTKYLVAYKLDHKTAKSLVKGAEKAFVSIPKKYLKTCTVDNGKEFASHDDLAKALRMKIYFAHPYHSWERGLNEHTNGLIRQYLPKKRSLADLSRKELAKIVDRLNNRPRRSLGYRTPQEAFFNLPLALQT